MTNGLVVMASYGRRLRRATKHYDISVSSAQRSASALYEHTHTHTRTRTCEFKYVILCFGETVREVLSCSIKALSHFMCCTRPVKNPNNIARNDMVTDSY